jgi:hypothetical protein
MNQNKLVKTNAQNLVLRAKQILGNNNGEGFIDSAVKILIAVVIGALVLGGLYMLFSQTILPTLTQKIQHMFNYSGG